MDIQTAAKYMKHGYRIKRASWEPGNYLTWYTVRDFLITPAELLADDWEIITEGIVKDFPITYSD